MTKNNKYVAVSFVIISVGAYMVYKWFKNRKENPNAGLSPVVSEGLKIIDRDKVLSKGSKGSEVALLQNKLGGLLIDGNFGEKTEAKLLQVKGVKKITLNQYDKK